MHRLFRPYKIKHNFVYMLISDLVLYSTAFLLTAVFVRDVVSPNQSHVFALMGENVPFSNIHFIKLKKC